MIKWLSSITISETESQSFYHFMDNRGELCRYFVGCE
jgi:hypothetical protein